MGFFDFLKGDDDSERVDVGWSCRGCGVTNSPIRYKCMLCHQFSLVTECFECHKNPREHHTKHEPRNFAFVTTAKSDWECDGCGACDETRRAKCRSCEDVDLCLNCFTKGLSEVHPEHPEEKDFGWYIYDDSGWECEGCETRNGDLAFKCGECRDLILCPKCILSAGEHHKLHPDPSLYTPIIALNRDWECNSCEKSLRKLIEKDRGEVRYSCNHCQDYDLCSKCIEKVAKNHKEHPQIEDFTPVLYIDNHPRD
ncbi:unnamed protein product [Rhizoctonia solani]|uniref:RanBP2-type domain-containing protein n=1 Tax=Rhizoctonia solani TaxID=456999 RepID=A0A8H3D0N0_9AGAM|nr:unnamed protein product [Rhizoctonia solani]